jgi:superfamily II DNA or RNA helicase
MDYSEGCIGIAAMTIVNDAVRKVVAPLTGSTEKSFRELKLQERDHLVVWLDQNGRKLMARVMALLPTAENAREIEKGCDGRSFEQWGYPSLDAKGFFDRIPEREIADRKGTDADLRDTFKLAATDFTALLIKTLWPEERVVYRTDHARLLVDFLVARFHRQSAFAEQLARFKVLGEVPSVPAAYAPWYAEHPDADVRLAPYQEAVCRASLGLEAIAWFMEQGTGKTAGSIQRVCAEAGRKRAETGRMYYVLVVCPPQVRLNWKNEFSRFATRAGKVVVCRGGQPKRISLLTKAISADPDCEYGVSVISYDSLVESLDAFKRVPWDLVIFDESHRFKSHVTLRAKCMMELRESSRQRMLLTGTPIGNSVMDLFSQLEVLGEGLSGFSTWKAYREFHGVWESVDEGARGVDRLVRVKNVPLLQERLSRLSFMITKKETGLQLPDKQPQTIEVEMTAAQADVYQQIQQQLALEIEDALSGQVDSMVIENVLTKLLRLAQVTSGFVTFPEIRSEEGELLREKKITRIDGANPKMDALVEFLKDEDRDPRAKTVVWACWREDIHHIHERLTREGIEHELYYGSTKQNLRDDIVHRFNHDPKLRVLVCNAQTAGEGLNLLGYCPDKHCASHHDGDGSRDTYCDAAVFFSQTWSALSRAQAEDRVHRRGTKHPIQLIDLTVPGSIDEEIRDRVMEKREMARTVTDVREILESVLGTLRDAGRVA